MKKIILILIALVAFGATVNAQTYTKVDNKTFQASKVERAKDTNSYKPTDNYYIAKDGKRYQIYLHTCKKGEHKGETFCYIRRVSKSGNPRWEKIDVKPEELSK